MNVMYQNPAFLHEPVDGIYSQISIARAPAVFRIGGQVAVDADGKERGSCDMKGQLETCSECVSRSLDHLGLG